jgi:hypothetical protein
MSKLLEQLVRESREERDKLQLEAEKVDWDTVDRELFARLQVAETERRAERRRSVGVPAGQGPAWGIGAVVLAAAAAAALVVGKTHEAAPVDGSLIVASQPAGTVVSVATGGELLVDGKPAVSGAVLHLGDVVEARGAPVTVERPGKLSWILEPSSLATVTHVQGALVLSLARGAVEAQVVPVASGEAFAVDVDGSRVAVHGTHLRVARIGDHVTVDLSEGVIVVGPAPRVGSTVGGLVTAPAHAEFAASDTSGTMTVSHEPSALRAPVSLGAPSGTVAQVPAAALATTAAPKPVDARTPPSAAVVARPQPTTPPSAPAPAQPPPVQPPQPDPNAASVIAAAVRSCMAVRSLDNVTVVVTTTLHLDLDADGNVRAARFAPSVATDVNTCAAPVIYRTRFTHDGTADVPIDVTVRGPGQSAP